MKLNYFLSTAIATKLIVLWLLAPSASSQIVPDSTVPTEVQRVGNEYKITGGGTAGNNLFHSFREFSIPAGITAVFEQGANIKNIFTRVTGSSLSNIEGTLRANGINNFFFINPNGIIFGPNAQLDVSGSFVASTASSIKFADGTQFSSTNPSSSPVLTVSVPLGLQFADNPGPIINRSVSQVKNPNPQLSPTTVGLQIKAGNTFALVGGDIKLEGGYVTATGGRVELGSVGNNSFVALTPINQGWQLGYEGVTNFQDIALSNTSTVDASGAGGTGEVRGRNITLTGSSQINVNAIGTESAGSLTVNASEAIELSGRPTLSRPSGFFAAVLTSTQGNGGNVIINTPRLTLQEGAAIGLATTGQGRGGQLTINAQLVEIVGATARDNSLLTTSTGGPADAGSITINTERLVVADGGAIVAITASTGKGGIININASQSVEVTGSRPLPVRGVITPSQISTTSGYEIFNFSGSGTAGNLNINTGQLIVSDGGRISAGSFRGGEAGNLTINARSISLNNGKILAESTAGSGGNIFINASNLLILRNNSLISATAGTAQAGGNGGNITITAPFIFAVPNQNSDISANAFSGTGGKVTITETGLFGIEFRARSTPLSDITASSQLGKPGNVIFNRPEVDPQTGIVTLPSQIVDSEKVVAQSCGSGGTLARGEFVIKGRGGFPTDPYEIPELNTGIADVGVISSSSPSPVSREDAPKQTSKVNAAPESIIEAQGWMRDSEGNVILTAIGSQVTPSSSGLNSTQCQGEKALDHKL
ncbi:filamentous hemagglutinin N-terminal domain-containing protein [Gloeothece verrucosa]|uniref:Filamentous hemagglutinin family outer membrane protein n=1 Tax=Gloeothece verrucosa (strain PCC 7822) TaxID=497965 RepID=E0UG30_GLOV7|nr:filamentous hemagglutinin N-terminal domain-containing protein [Gloeothece verrucosa]ADN15531.1 filamentous hemagglutinin family outer membrane protein [Gloeothece verrucosa PCC 7822]